MASNNKMRAIRAYLIAIIVTLIIAGGFAGAVYYYVAIKEASAPIVSEPINYIPDKAENLTILGVLETTPTSKEYSSSHTIFAVIRFLPQKKQVYVLPLPSDTACHLNTKTASLYEFYKTVGILQAQRALSSTLNLGIERHVIFSRESFTSLIEGLGGISYEIVEPFSWTDPIYGDKYTLPVGKQLLTGVNLYQMLSQESEEPERTRRQGQLISEIINQSVKNGAAENLSNIFSTIVNGAKTNISRNDFDFREKALYYTFNNNIAPATFLVPSGEWKLPDIPNAKKELLFLSVDFRKMLAYTFESEPLADI